MLNLIEVKKLEENISSLILEVKAHDSRSGFALKQLDLIASLLETKSDNLIKGFVPGVGYKIDAKFEIGLDKVKDNLSKGELDLETVKKLTDFYKAQAELQEKKIKSLREEASKFKKGQTPLDFSLNFQKVNEEYREIATTFNSLSYIKQHLEDELNSLANANLIKIGETVVQRLDATSPKPNPKLNFSKKLSDYKELENSALRYIRESGLNSDNLVTPDQIFIAIKEAKRRFDLMQDPKALFKKPRAFQAERILREYAKYLIPESSIKTIVDTLKNLETITGVEIPQLKVVKLGAIDYTKLTPNTTVIEARKLVEQAKQVKQDWTNTQKAVADEIASGSTKDYITKEAKKNTEQGARIAKDWEEGKQAVQIESEKNATKSNAPLKDWNAIKSKILEETKQREINTIVAEPTIATELKDASNKKLFDDLTTEFQNLVKANNGADIAKKIKEIEATGDKSKLALAQAARKAATVSVLQERKVDKIVSTGESEKYFKDLVKEFQDLAKANNGIEIANKIREIEATGDKSKITIAQAARKAAVVDVKNSNTFNKEINKVESQKYFQDLVTEFQKLAKSNDEVAIAKKVKEIEATGDKTKIAMAQAARKAAVVEVKNDRTFNKYLTNSVDPAINLDTTENKKLFENLSTEFETLIKAKKFQEIKVRIKEITDAGDYQKLVIAQTARRAVMSETWNARRDKNTTRGNSQSTLIERRASEMGYNAAVLPKATQILADHNLLTVHGTVDIDRLNSLSTADSDAIKGKIVEKLEEFEISSRLIGQIDSNLGAKSALSPYLKYNKLSDPDVPDSEVTLSKLISRDIMKAISSESAREYIKQRKAVGNDINQIHANIASYWRDRVNNAQTTGEYRDICSAAIERTLERFKAEKGSAIDVKLLRDQLTPEFEFTLLSTIAANSSSLAPRTLVEVEFATAQENAESGTVIRLKEKTLSRTSSIRPLPANLTGTVVEEERTHEFVEIPDEEKLIEAHRNLGLVAEEASEFEQYAIQEQARLAGNQRTYVRSEKFNDFMGSAFRGNKALKAYIEHEMEDKRDEMMFNLLGSVIGHGDSEKVRILGETLKKANFWLASAKDQRVLLNALWEKGIPGINATAGGLRKKIINRVTRAFGLRRNFDIGGGHVVEANVITYGIGHVTDKFGDFLADNISKWRVSKAIGLDKTLKYENRKKRKSLLEAVFALGGRLVFGPMIWALNRIGVIARIKSAFNGALLKYGLKGKVGALGTIVDGAKVAWHVGKAFIGGVQSAVLGYAIGYLVGGPGFAAFTGAAFATHRIVSMLADSKGVFVKDYTNFANRLSAAREAKLFAKGGMANVAANPAKGAINAIFQAEGVAVRLSNLAKLSAAFRGWSITSGLLLIAGADPLLAILGGLGFQVGGYFIRKGAVALGARIATSVIEPLSVIIKATRLYRGAAFLGRALRLLGKFPLFDAIGISYGVNYYIEQVELIRKYLNNEITAEAFTAQMFSLANLGNAALSTFGYVTGIAGATRLAISIVGRIFHVSILPAAASAASWGVFFGSIIGGVTAYLLGGTVLQIGLAATFGGILGGIGALIGAVIANVPGAIFGFSIGASLGTALGWFAGKALDSVKNLLGGISALLGLIGLIKAKSFTEFVQSFLMLSMSLALAAPPVLAAAIILPSIYVPGLIVPITKNVSVRKLFYGHPSSTELVYTLQLSQGDDVTNANVTDVDVTFTDRLVNPEFIRDISITTGLGSSNISNTGKSIVYKYKGGAKGFHNETFTYKIKLTKPLAELAGEDGLCNIVSGSAKVTFSEGVPVSNLLNDTICIDKNGNEIVKSKSKRKLILANGGLPIDPDAGTITQCSYSIGGGSSHSDGLALDIGAASGTPIKSIEDGVIVGIKRWNGRDGIAGGTGNEIVVQHNIPGVGTVKSLYGHLLDFEVDTIGEKVLKGQVIGYVGTTGWSTGNHTHFATWVNAKPTEPCCLIDCTKYTNTNLNAALSCNNKSSPYYSDPRTQCSY